MKKQIDAHREEKKTLGDGEIIITKNVQIPGKCCFHVLQNLGRL